MIAIFSKFDMAGGSERRCVELANGIQKYTNHDAVLLSERGFPESLEGIRNVPVIPNALEQPHWLYQADCVIVVNTDCKEFSKMDYWMGKTIRHDKSVSIESIKKMLFLYNYLVSPCQYLHEIAQKTNVGILVTNHKFFDEITKEDRYQRVRSLPRYVLASPIDPDSVITRVRKGYGFVFGCHSKGASSKWNQDWPRLVDYITARYSEASFRFMGTRQEIPKATCLKEDEQSVSEFLDLLDVFVFFPDYKREEPWARVIAEAMMAGLPIIALDRGGTSDQVLKWNNGILCKRFDDYHKALIYLIEHHDMVEVMSRNSLRIAREFTTENIIKRLMEII